jgi:2-amino-4-hydroxy-6-hydroxymethyldihydropteridine diphosphokinase
MGTPSVFLGLGSNLGDREAALRNACVELRGRGFRLTVQSPLYETEPLGGPPQDWFLNQVVGGETALSPQAMLQACLDTEGALGRVRTVPNGPRGIDVDLLLFGDTVIESDQLTLPHPRLHQRLFVLVPLADVAGDQVYPGRGVTITELLRACPDRSMVRPLRLPTNA